MSTYPRLEARVSALERRQINTDARIEEVNEDMTTGFKHISKDMEAGYKQLTEYQMKTEENAEERFNKIEATLNQHTARFDQLEALLTQILERLPQNGQ